MNKLEEKENFLNMKKKSSIILFVCIVLISSIVLAQTSFNAELESNKEVLKPGDTVEVTLKLKEFSEHGTGINAIVMTLDYDKTIFNELTEDNFKALESWGKPTFNSEKGIILLLSNSFVNVEHDALKINLTVRDNIDNNITTEVKLKDISAADAQSDIELEDIVLNLQIGNLADNISEESNLQVVVISAIIAILVVGTAVIVIIKRKK